MQPRASLRPHPVRPRTWPLSFKVPVQAAILTFLVATVSTQAALHLAREREDRLMETSLSVLAEGIAGAVAPVVAAGPGTVERVLEGVAGAAPAGILAAVRVEWRGADGMPLSARAGAPAALAGAGTHTFSVERTVTPPGGGAVAVRLVADGSALAADRRVDQLRVALVDLAISLIGALVALAFVRATLKPVAALTADLVAGRTGGRAPPVELEPLSTEFGRLQRVMKERVAAEEERSEALMRLAEQERATGLSKLAASMAHEVRNPLAGLMNAVSTLRRFGDDPAVRAESLDLIERGLSSIERVTGAALSTYRPARAGAGFGPEDLADLRVLVGPEARRRAVALLWDVAIEGPVEADPDILRQVLLNLLLNAVKASGSGGEVRLVARYGDGELSVAVSDTGPGLPGDVRRFLAGGPDQPFPRADALGLWTVVRLLDDVGGRLSVDTHPGRGTTVTARLAASPATRADAA